MCKKDLHFIVVGVWTYWVDMNWLYVLATGCEEKSKVNSKR